MCKIKWQNHKITCLSRWFPTDSLTSPQVSSPWSESMSQLMIKLDRLNLDIEEAMSANSSPCGTPGTKRKTQVSALSGAVKHGCTLYAVYTTRQPADRLLRFGLYTFLSSTCCILVHAWFSKINLLCSGDRETQWIIWTDALDSNEL